MPRGVDRYDEARHQGRLWTPTVLYPIMSCWWDAADLSTMVQASNLVQTWNNKGNLGGALSQGTSGSRPSYTPNAVRGRPAVVSDGSKNMSTGTLAVPSGTSAFTFVAVAIAGPGGSGSVRGITYFGANNFNAMPALAWNTSNNRLGGDSFGGGVTGPTTTITDTSHILMWHRVAAGVENLYVDGLQGTQAASSTNISGTTAVGIFTWPAGFAAGGSIQEVMLLSSALSTRDRTVLEAYLGWKWGIPLIASHPFANRPPLIGD